MTRVRMVMGEKIIERRGTVWVRMCASEWQSVCMRHVTNLSPGSGFGLFGTHRSIAIHPHSHTCE